MDDSILQRVAIGDIEAVQDCLDRYSGLVWSCARRYCNNAADAEDAVQDVFIEIWKHAGRYDPSAASEPTFVAMIARRRLIDRWRREERRPDRDASPIEHSEAEAAWHGVRQIELSDEAQRAAAAVQELRPEQQAVLKLSIYSGWSHQRIAEHTNLPLGTVKTHVRRGLLRVRESLRLAESVNQEGATS